MQKDSTCLGVSHAVTHSKHRVSNPQEQCGSFFRVISSKFPCDQLLEGFSDTVALVSELVFSFLPLTTRHL